MVFRFTDLEGDGLGGGKWGSREQARKPRKLY
jgi:hypothetical protein